MPDLVSQGRGMPCVSSEPVFAELAAYPWTDWEDASLQHVALYLRGNKSLQLPTEWKECFPKRV